MILQMFIIYYIIPEWILRTFSKGILYIWMPQTDIIETVLEIKSELN